eukprot:scaffold269_cov404-Prasinococcus_capsulatus_cf.AAC.16
MQRPARKPGWGGHCGGCKAAVEAVPTFSQAACAKSFAAAAGKDVSHVAALPTSARGPSEGALSAGGRPRRTRGLFRSLAAGAACSVVALSGSRAGGAELDSSSSSSSSRRKVSSANLRGLSGSRQKGCTG